MSLLGVYGEAALVFYNSKNIFASVNRQRAF